VRGQRGESGDGHLVATVLGLGATLALCRGNDLGSELEIRIWDWVAVVCLILGTPLVLDVVVGDIHKGPLITGKKPIFAK
jgi:hypothetical protein